MNLRMKLTVLAGVLSYMDLHPESFRMIDDAMGHIVKIRDDVGKLTVEGKLLRPVVYMFIVYFVMGCCMKKK